MRWIAAGVTFVNIATLCGLVFGIIGRGLNPFLASIAFTLGLFAAILAYFRIDDPETIENGSKLKSAADRYRDIWKWLLAACFAIFAVRSFCWLFYIDTDQFRIQSPNNLGDLALHITLIKDFASGASLWLDNPIFEGSKLRYPAGIDLFNGLLYLQHVGLIRGLVWVGLLGSIATFGAFYRWGRTFAVAAFLFNGGVAGFKFFDDYKFADYQGVNDVAWKSIPLSMFVTQRGLLYAIPGGLILLWHWREKYFRSPGGTGSVPSQIPGTSQSSSLHQGPLPFWVELSIYASMPLFHVHTFLALSGVLVCIAIFGHAPTCKSIGLLIGSALVPATFLVWLITDGFQAGSVFDWQAGWVQHEKGSEMSAPFFIFWLKNFGAWIPLVLILLGVTCRNLYRSNKQAVFKLVAAIAFLAIGLCLFRIWKIGFGWQPAVVLALSLAALIWAAFLVFTEGNDQEQKIPEDALFLFAASAIFVSACFVKTAPWGWDNLKIMIWSYFIVLPFLWKEVIQPWPLAARVSTLFVLFGSGFVSLFGGLAVGRPGFGFADHAEVDGVAHAIAALPLEARFATHPTYNHPILLDGRNVVLGYPGHLWTEGFDYGPKLQQLNQLMNGEANWREIADQLHVRYVFWGREEIANYPNSKRPWEATVTRLSAGNWGAIYDLNAPLGASPP